MWRREKSKGRERHRALDRYGEHCRSELTFLCREDGLNWAYKHHHDHHDGEYGDGVAGHPQDKGIQWKLLPGSQCY